MVIGAVVFVASVLYAAAYLRDRYAKHTASAHQQQVPLTEQTTHDEPSDKKPAERQWREK